MKPFERAFRERYQEGVELSAPSAKALREAAELDHPSYTKLQLGQSLLGEAAVLFLDIRGYTRLAMAFADQPAKTARILDAVVGGAVEALPAYGAHINDYTGDGVMAIFGDGPGSLDRIHDAAIFAAVDLITDMSKTLRAQLIDIGIDDPVQVSIGLVSGPVLWKRVGTEECNRVMAIGEVAPLAAKYVSGKETKAWETMIGGEIIDAVPPKFRQKADDYVRIYKDAEMKRQRWLLDTDALLPHSGSAEAIAALRLASAATVPPALPTPKPAPPRRGSGTRHERTTG